MPSVIQSMTAFAARDQIRDRLAWAWELRGVNGRGLELRLKLPDGLPGLETALRARLTAGLARGNVSLVLRLTRGDGPGTAEIDPAVLDRALLAVQQVQVRAAALGMTLAPPTAAEVLAMRGVTGSAAQDNAVDDGLVSLLAGDVEHVLADFIAMRRAEGQALHGIIVAQLEEIAALTDAAAGLAAARRDDARATLRAALRRVFEDVPEIDEARVAQELALIAVKADVTEEIDRLRAHVAAARALLGDARPAGRRLDFLAQEFNREANTLCSKAQSAGLTQVGLALKAVIDQLREQVQNVE